MQINRVCVVILNWNQPETTQDCVAHVLSQSCLNATILVVDNGSQHDKIPVVANLPPNVLLIKNQRNLGFAGGMNIGIEYAISRSFDYVWLLNNDCFPDPGCLDGLVDTMEQDRSVLAALPRLRCQDGSPHIVGAILDWKSGKQGYVFELPPDRGINRRFTLHGCAMFIRASALREIGGFDERFFAYREEDDWCLRAAGPDKCLAVVESATAVHIGGYSSGGSSSPLAAHLTTRNGWLLIRKHVKSVDQPPVLLRYIADRLAEAGKRYSDGMPQVGDAIISGLMAGVRSRYGPPKLKPPPEWLISVAKSVSWRLRSILRGLAGSYPFQSARLKDQ